MSAAYPDPPVPPPAPSLPTPPQLAATRRQRSESPPEVSTSGGGQGVQAATPRCSNPTGVPESRSLLAQATDPPGKKGGEDLCARLDPSWGEGRCPLVDLVRALRWPALPTKQDRLTSPQEDVSFP